MSRIDRTTEHRKHTAKEVLASVYVAFKYLIIVKDISHMRQAFGRRASLTVKECMYVSDFSPSLQIQAITNLKFLHLPFQPHSLHWFTFKHFTGMAGGFSFVSKRRW